MRVENKEAWTLMALHRLKSYVTDVKRRLNSRLRRSAQQRARSLRELESLDSIVFREAVVLDVPALAELHVVTWNVTYNTTRGPTIATRTSQWSRIIAEPIRRDFVLVLEDGEGRLIGFTWGKPHEGEFEGELSKIYLRFEYHGLGLGRRMMGETARRFIDRGIHSMILFAEVTNPTLGFYDRMGGERLLDEQGRFGGAYVWRDLNALLP
ncbi:MAG: N-acetyltransferase family protein [Fimbriimonas sp.]